MNLCESCNHTECEWLKSGIDFKACADHKPITRADLASLASWKAEASEVLGKLDLQEIGRQIECKLGESVAEQVLPAIVQLRADLAARDAEIAVDAGRLRDAAMRVWGEDAHGCDTPDRLADAILGLRAQIADLKRGGVVVPDITDEDFESVSVLMQENGIGCHDSENDSFRRIVASTWAYAQGAFVDLSRLRTIPADRVLGEGEERVRWIPVDEAIPQDRQNIGFIVSCERDDFLHGRVYGGNFNASYFENRFGGFQTHGFSCMASHWFPFPPVPDSLRAQPTQEPTT